MVTAPADTRRRPRHVIAIGASTGGPAAVVDLLRVVPRHYPYPILLVLHLSAPFASALAEWLGRESQLPVRTARDGEPLPEHGVVLAPADQHLVLEGARLRLTTDTPRHSCRPSVDVLFESVARQTGARGVGVLLTGMGRDGAEGLLAIRRAGGVTIAQDEDSSVVYGMPREAAAIGAAQHVMSPAAAGAFVASLATSTAGR
jgi:two-component system, chemotaxis family, protein-glutamate methylesterase/glutaminase